LRLEIENLRNHNATLKEGSNPDEKSLLMQHEVVDIDGKTFTSLTGSMGLRWQCGVNNIRKSVFQNLE
jgi:hypothetical protein